jgi:hypothetical protein
MVPDLCYDLPVPRVDLPLAELVAYRSDASEPGDFDAFWSEQLQDGRARAWPSRSEPYARGVYGDLLVDDVTFSGGRATRSLRCPASCTCRATGEGAGSRWSTLSIRRRASPRS